MRLYSERGRRNDDSFDVRDYTMDHGEQLTGLHFTLESIPQRYYLDPSLSIFIRYLALALSISQQ
jgi:hypothetical protein